MPLLANLKAFDNSENGEFVIYGSVCSGIEAASVAWHTLGWRAAFVSEIDAFPRAVLKHHYPDVPLHGDFTTIDGGHYAAIDVLVGGTPCQSFSIAGLRGGLADERGNLALEFCRLAQRLGPKWVVWENVPGVLSMDGGRAFASILGGLSECGYGVAYRVLDAQFVRIHGFGRAVPQRRRRVFVVGYLGDWRRAAAVLFERHSLQRNPPPRRQAREGIIHSVAPSLVSSGRGVERGGDTRGQDPVIAVHSSGVAGTIGANGKAAGSATSQDAENGLLVAHSLRGDGFDASEDGTGRGTPLVQVPQGVALRGRDGGATAELTGDVMTSLRTGGGGGDKPHVLLPIPMLANGNEGANGAGIGQEGDPAFTLQAGVLQAVATPPHFAIQAGALRENPDSGPDGVGIQEGHAYTLETRAEVQAVCFDETQITSATNRCQPQPGDPSHPLAAGARPPTLAYRTTGNDGAYETGDITDSLTTGTDPTAITLLQSWRVRRLTPRECERLQGFPDDYTLISMRGKPAADGPRYKALGNSMAVNVMRWIGRRIEMVEQLTIQR